MQFLSVRSGLVAYLAVAMLAMFWQVFMKGFLTVCEYNAGACTVTFVDYAWVALGWPVHLILWQAI